MKPLSVIVAQSNAKTGEFLTKSLFNHFRVVHSADNLNELLNSIPKHRADVAVVDLELADLKQLQELTLQFSSTKIVCTHPWQTKECGQRRLPPELPIVANLLTFGPSSWPPAA